MFYTPQLVGDAQVGDGTVVDVHLPKMILPEGVKSCSAGKNHSIATMKDGSVLAWGCNDDCLLGTGWTVKQQEPKQVFPDILSGVLDAAAGSKHNLALTEDGDVLAWGSNDYGQLGDGTTTARRKPVKVKLSGGFSRARAIAAGWYHSVALTDSGEVFCRSMNKKHNI